MVGMRQLSDDAIKAEAIRWLHDRYPWVPIDERISIRTGFVAGYRLARDHATEDARPKATTSEALDQ